MAVDKPIECENDQNDIKSLTNSLQNRKRKTKKQ